MELDRVNGHFVNGLNEEVELEDGLVYGILKSSDLKNTVINQTRKFTIVTQKKVGQETKFIKSEYPATFTLVLPQDNKPVMLDDTCYFIGFDKVEFAVYALILLNSDTTMQFLRSVTFADAKRTFTKDVLMWIDLLELGNKIDKLDLTKELQKLNEMYNLDLSLELWDSFIAEMTPIHKR